jgi:hypothetical protein
VTAPRYASHPTVVAPNVETSTDTLAAAAADADVSVASQAARATTVGALTVESASPAPLDGPRNPGRALRLPEENDPAPHLGRMVAMSVWAAGVALLGMVVAIRTFVAIMLGPGPDWLVPTVMSLGIGGTICAGIAFATVHHKWLPWELLGLASLLLGANLVLVITEL